MLLLYVELAQSAYIMYIELVKYKNENSVNICDMLPGHNWQGKLEIMEF